MLIRRLLFLLVAGLMALALVMLVVWPMPDSSLRGPEPGEVAVRSTEVLKLGYNMPERSAMHAAAVRLANAVSEASQGRLQIQLFPNQQLGNDHQMLEMARRGELDLILTPSAKLSVAVPEMQYPDLPFYFPAQEDLYHLLDGEPGRLLLNRLRRIGLVGITFWGNGFKHFTANKPLLSPADFDGERFRVMKSRLLQEQFELLGAEAIPIDFHQVKEALRDGVVEGQENPLVAIHSMGIHAVQTDLTLSSHAYLAYVLSINESRYSKLSSAMQTLLLEKAREITDWQRAETRRLEETFLAEIQASGTRVHRLTDEQRAGFRQRLVPLASRFESVIGSDLLALTDSYLYQNYPDQKRRLIGVDVDLGADTEGIGRDIKRGVELALAQYNAHRSVDSYRLAPWVVNNLGQPDRAGRNLQTLAEDPAVLAVIAGGGSAALKGQLPIVETLDFPVLSPWAAESELLAGGEYEQLFGLTQVTPLVVRSLAARLNADSTGEPGLLIEAGAWGQDFERALRGQLAMQGRLLGQVVRIAMGQTPATIEQQVSQLPESGTLVLAVRGRERNVAIQALAARYPGRQVYSIREGIIESPLDIQCLHSWSDNSAFRLLMQQYRARYDEEPRVPSAVAQGYDGAGLLINALSSLEPGFDREQITRAMLRALSFNGVIKRYRSPFSTSQRQALTSEDYYWSSKRCVVPGDQD
ncbi:MAG: hypothetical protein CMI01_12580 [Oceanospirillaceae bacterium]|nr:hypothetical protein [Oceanospirillaceae bacterium]